ncbi:MAG: HAMP domain-containing sensor histidine kinase [Acidimicrobiaceae bacterium]|nr:HAMP domain-containing sensor histidine kinase [Acidimicrobiaceae bacterium]MDE0606542.1 HAMP domain-containing sensor histidine kinase [Acidimicrobiaceae bacterium]
MSLRLRIALAVAGVVTLVVVAVGFSLHRTTESSLIAEVDADLLERSLIVSALGAERVDGLDVGALIRLRREGNFLRSGRVDPFQNLVAFDALVRVLDPKGAVIGVFEKEFSAATDASLLEAAYEKAVLHDGSSSSGSIRVMTIALGDTGFIQIARPLDEVEAVLADLAMRTGLIGAAAIIGAALAAWIIAGAVAKPIRRLTEVAENVAESGDLSLEVERTGSDEVGRLASSFCTMLDALAVSRRQQHQMVMDASHELRTPLMSLRANIDVLSRGHELDDQDHAAIIGDLDAELSELSDLVAELVELAVDVRTDEDPVPLTLEEIALPVVDRARRRTERHIEVSIERSLMLDARPEALARAMRNLVDNAAKFSPAGSAIRVVVDGGMFAVHDQGPGIPEAQRKVVFARFHRLEPSQALPGSGLGLAIVGDVVEVHGGSVFVTDSPEGGAAVGFRLPTIDG